MSPPLVERNTGDVIPASDHNDVKDYIEDGTFRVNTLSLSIQAVGSVIDSSGNERFGTRKLGLPTAASDPVSGNLEGDVYYNTAIDMIKSFNGSVWAALFSPAVVYKASGTISVAATTTTYDVNFFDVAFAAAELVASDGIQIELSVDTATVNMNCSVDFENTTSNPVGTDRALTQSASGVANYKLYQGANTTTTVTGSKLEFDDSGAQPSGTNELWLTGDANVFTTAFSLRINLRHTSVSGLLKLVRYKVLIIKSS